MHEPDRPPGTKIITDKRFTVQWMANISLFGGLIVTVIGAVLAMVSGLFGFFILALPGITLAILSARLARRVPDQRAHTTAAFSIVLHVLFFVILYLLFLFFKEAGQAI